MRGTLSEREHYKRNSDGASKGKLDPSDCAFRFRNSEGELIFAESRKIE